MTIRLIWDFFGPDAHGTATHHGIHLQEFITREAIDVSAMGIGTAGEGHAMSWCELLVADEARVSAALRPQRRVRAENFDKIEWH